MREAKVLPPRPMERSRADALRQSYLEHLQSQQGLSDHSIAAYAVSVRGLIDAMQLPEKAADLDALAIRRYLLTLSQQHAVATVKVYAAGLGTSGSGLAIKRWSAWRVGPLAIQSRFQAGARLD
nr:site-specific integrase [Thiorhodococcus mannitoliphagus]